jgi:signal peptidase complex subunit 1
VLQDFQGQYLAEILSTGMLIVSGALAFLVGFFTQDIYQTLYIGLGGTALTFLVVVPPWPFFNQHPLSWLPSRTGKGAWAQGITVEMDDKKAS